MDRVGERIRELRKERGWTQTFLAKKVNVSPQVVSNWERKYTDPDHDDVVRLSEAFNESADYILGRTKLRRSEIEKRITNDQAKNAVIEAYDRLPQHKKKIVDDMIKVLLDEGT